MSKARRIVKSIAAAEGLTMTEVVAKLNEHRKPEDKTTPQNLANKFTRGSFRYSDAEEIAEVLGYEIVWQKKVDRR